MRLDCGSEDFDEHTVHVVSLDSVPEQRHENEVVAQNVENAATGLRAGKLLGDVQYNEQDCQRCAEVEQNSRNCTATSFAEDATKHTKH